MGYPEPVNSSPLFSSFPVVPTSRYFKNLDDKPTNKLGDCGYVAMSMLLSFYDCVINDSIIAENYETISNASWHEFANDDFFYSPGVINIEQEQSFRWLDDINQEAFDIFENNTSNEYKALVEQSVLVEMRRSITRRSFLGHLFELALDTHILKTSSDNQFNPILNNQSPSFVLGGGVTYETMRALLIEYINHNPYLRSNNVELESFHANNAYEKTIMNQRIVAHLQAGEPIILGVSGHVCVAYAYDAEHQLVIVNNGHSRNSNVVCYNLEDCNDYYCFDFGPIYRHECSHNFDGFCLYGDSFSTHIIANNDYDYPERYDDYETRKYHYIDGLDFSTIRKRDGFIQSEVVNLSAIETSEKDSYLAFEFNTPTIQSITIDISFWSNNEHLDSTDAYALVKYGTSLTSMTTCFNLLTDIKLSTDRTKKDSLSFSFKHTLIHYFQISVFSSRFVGGTRNFGRISLSKVTIYTLD